MEKERIMNENLQLELQEKNKYTQIWKRPEYKVYSNECNKLETIENWIIKKPIKTITIIGCGEGYGLHYFSRKGYDVKGLDIVNVNRFPQYKVIEEPVWKANIPFSDLIIAIDVLEHIPKEKIAETLINISKSCKFFFFSIFCNKDKLGVLIGQRLHLTILKPEEWIIAVRKYFKIESFNGGTVSIDIKGEGRYGK